MTAIQSVLSPRNLWIRRALVMLFLALATTSAGAVDIQKLTRDTQRTSQSSGQVTFVWWMPQAWWEASLNSNPSLTPEGRTQILAVLDEYLLFAVVRARMASTGAIDARPKAEMLSNARLEIDGTKIDPIPPQDLAPTAQAILLGIKPILASLLGKFGQSVEIVAYPGKHDGKRLLDAAQPGSFRYTLYDETFTWRLPLPSLLPAKFDPKTGDEFPGDYQFNPYTGAPLSTK
jgi:hypothetical protein